MSDYRAPLKDIRFVLHYLGGMEALKALPAFEDITSELVDAVLEEAARFAEERLAPLYQPADRWATRLVDGQVRVPEEIKTLFSQFVGDGWASLSGHTEYGGQGLPQLVATPVSELWRSANLAFSLSILLGHAAEETIHRHGDEALKRKFLPKLVSGQWTGTMNLTEPQAGSDLALLRATARRQGDHYRITGRKIFITWGDHDMAENIVHLVLARTPDAPPGVKGISLFVVPKFLVDDSGSLAGRNEVVTVSIEEKLGIHASPTCVLSYGDEDGAVGYLVGQEHQGLQYMFTMMNRARLGVGVDGVGIAERAYQMAVSYARERVQGNAPELESAVTIIHHPDVRRMLMTMKAYTEAMRSLAYQAALYLDLAEQAPRAGAAARSEDRVALLTPIVKGWCTEVAQEVTNLAVQVHGGMGYMEETGVAQTVRDARITTIYEGTTGIQANDLIGRKLIRDGGKAMGELLAEIEAADRALASRGGVLEVVRRSLLRGVGQVAEAADFVLKAHVNDVHAPGSASVNFLMLAGTVLGGWQMAKGALAASEQLADGGAENGPFLEAKLVTARFYAEHVMPRADGYLASVLAGSASIMGLGEEQF